MSQGWFAYAPMSRAVYVGDPDAGLPGPTAPPGESGAPDPDRRPELADLGRLARRGVKSALKVARADEAITPGRLIRDFLGDSADEAEIAEETWASYEGVNMQRAIDAWLAEQGRTHRLVGIRCMNGDTNLPELLSPHTHPFSASVGNIARINLPCGPEGATMACVNFGLYLVETGAGRVVLFQRQSNPMHGRVQASVQVLAHDAETARAIGAELRELSRIHNVFRGQVLTLGGDMFGYGESVLAFHRRPTLTRDDLILDNDVLAAIERQIVGVARHRDALLAAGQHLKRGVLLYGPPGVGKTHTIRYLMSTLTDVTVIQISGSALRFISDACSAARSLAPSIVVVEDVDLIAEDRGEHPGDHPMLFQLLNEMDGLGDDIDVAFVLTTNRADLLEPALAARPGRIDEAVAIAFPDLTARRRLFDLYRGSLQLDAPEERIEAALTRADGVTASFLKELLRRTALAAAERLDTDPGSDPSATPLTATAADLDNALDGLLGTRSRMTRTLLGAGNETATPTE